VTKGRIFAAVITLLMRQQIRRESEAAISSDHTSPSTSTQKSDLQCIQCKLDPSVTYQKKVTTYTHSQLNEPLRSSFHTRREQVLRCFNIDKDDNGECCCPCCGDNSTERYKGESVISHMESDHCAVMEF
jgi:hypothetical protein